MNNKNKFILVFTISLVIVFFTIRIYQTNPIDLFDSHTGLQKKISESIMLEIKNGLELYKNREGHYPVTDSKYYLDSLYGILKIDPAYLYQDIISNNKITSINFNKGKYENTFVGIGSPQYLVRYNSFDGNTYNIYVQYLNE